MATPLDAQTQLAALAADRERLTSSLRTPWPLMVAAGAAPAWFVADAAGSHPGAGYQPSNGYLLALGILLVVAHLVRRETGIRFRSLGAGGWAAVIGGLVLTLAMFSTALALVSTGHRAWVIAPTLVAWVGGTLCAAGWFRSCLHAVNRG